MIKYRPQRGTLAESLEDAMEFDSLNHLFYFLETHLLIPMFGDNFSIKIKYYGFDPKCNQDLFLVTDSNNAIGFIYEENTNRKDDYSLIDTYY